MKEFHSISNNFKNSTGIQTDLQGIRDITGIFTSGIKKIDFSKFPRILQVGKDLKIYKSFRHIV